ncbi:hypothetical protein J3R30DRAFT_1674957 [Lentinula aciculospora]|uniref:RanBD1 domain-containing protein n=1 Tax=Lentinula aciculospora TaxID=153920 RepID=A0A9W8ZXA7_9AGAR|nr:hypothetical protein J3R30DRAFT_1674957 [Lentinula aciculospora]
MKRGADKQLTKDNPDDEDPEYGGQVGLQKAEDSVLATRKMKGLPKRSAGSVTSSPSSESVTDTRPKFGGFGGFGTGASSSFQFTPPASPFSPSSSTTTSPFTKPAVASNASNAAKTFSSLLGSASGPQSSSFNPAPLTSQPTLPDISESDGDAAVEYYKSLRGLNASIVTAITKAVERDPFADVSFLLERYKSFRTNVQKDYDDNTRKSNRSSSASLSTASVGSFSMPTPPASFSGFGAKVSESSSSTSPAPGGGFTPKLDSDKPLSSPFSFPSTKPSSSSSAFSFSPAGSINPPTSISSSKPGESTPKISESSTTTSLFGSKAPPLPSSAFSFGTPPSTSGSTPNLFGVPPSPSVFGMPSTSTPFGTSGTIPKFTGFGGFGSAGRSTPSAGSIGNPVGFGFGSPTKSESSSGFSFANPPSSSIKAKEKTTEGEVEEGGNIQATQSDMNADEPRSKLLGVNPHDEEGEGEENEETVHFVRSKVFRMKKVEEGTSGWAEMGTGILRVKKHKDTGQRRLLLRNSNTGKIIINFNLYTGLKPTVNKKTLMFIGHEGGASQTYNIRTKTEDQASELKKVLDREIAFVKAKQDG